MRLSRPSGPGHHFRELDSADFLCRSAQRISCAAPLGCIIVILSANANFLLIDSDFRFPSRNSPFDLLFFPTHWNNGYQGPSEVFHGSNSDVPEEPKRWDCSMLSTWMSTVVIQQDIPRVFFFLESLFLWLWSTEFMSAFSVDLNNAIKAQRHLETQLTENTSVKEVSCVLPVTAGAKISDIKFYILLR